MYIVALLSVEGHHMRKKKFDRLLTDYNIRPLESLSERGLFRAGPYIVEIKDNVKNLVIPNLISEAKVQALAILAFTNHPVNKLLLSDLINNEKVMFSVTSIFVKGRMAVLLVQDKKESLSYIFTVRPEKLPTKQLDKIFKDLPFLYEEVIRDATATREDENNE